MDFEQNEQTNEQMEQCEQPIYGPFDPIPLPAPTTTTTTTTQAVKNQFPTSTVPTASADIEIDSLLLQQFSCLGTTDHEDLVKQFQNLMNNQMNEDSARFFLEMSNWNLQTAVGCYLDFCNVQTLPSMKIIEQSCTSAYQQAWRMQNNGAEDWPNGCYLMSLSQRQRIEIPALKPGVSCDILANLPPSQPPKAIMWRLCTPNGWYFGDALYMIPPGSTDSEEDLANRMSQLQTGSVKLDDFPQANVVLSVNMEG